MWLIPVNQLPGSGEPKYEILDSASPASSNKWILEVVECHYIIVKYPLCNGEPKHEIFIAFSFSSNMWFLADVEGHYIIVKFPLCSGFEEPPL